MKKALQTIEEYLGLSDWKFHPRIERGQRGDYFWIRSDYFVDLSKHLPQPRNPIKMVLIDFDSSTGANIFGDQPGWERVGSFAVSGPYYAWPEFDYNGDYSAMIFFAEKYNSIVPILLKTDPDVVDSSTLMDDNRFWNFFEIVQPEIYVVETESFFFAAREKLAVDCLDSKNVWDSI